MKFNVLPLDDRVLERFNASIAGRPDLMGPRTSLTLYEGMIGLSENAFINMKNRSYTITAELDDSQEWSRRRDHRARRTHRRMEPVPEKRPTEIRLQLARTRALRGERPPRRSPPAPSRSAGSSSTTAGRCPARAGRGDFFVNGEQVASGRIDRTIPFFIGTEPADVGMDDLTPVTHDYKAYDNKFTGTIRKIVIGVGPVGEAFDPPLEWNGVG